MHMIGHDYPRNKAIPLTIKIFQSFSDNFGMLVVAEETRTAALVDHGIKPFPTLAIIFDLLDLVLIYGAWKAVHKPKCNSLDDRSTVEMRQISPAVPSTMRAENP